ncbi:MAG: endonuclease/exonuclease/phosphatase family protein [Methylobacter sp.]|jgi:maltose 6'-phosphate phosphatase|nr:endonuclease/exonuclease/phosphatase family protein [Methylobacter sp.]
MDKIQLLYVENVISRKKAEVEQTLRFFMRVQNAGYDKRIDVVWAGEDGAWQTLPANYHSTMGHDKEYWQAQASFKLSADQSLPGNIQFGLRYRISGHEYWDNNQGLNYVSQADSGVNAIGAPPVLNIGFADRFEEGQKNIPVTVAVHNFQSGDKVTLHWTTDNWRHSQKTPCHFKRAYWDKEVLSNARNPNQYGSTIWKGWLKIGQAFRLQYSICLERNGELFWDNNDGNNYSLSHEPLKVLILNLHCYQEDHQDDKFSQIAKAIKELDVDVVCLQEVAELWNDGDGDWASNSARIINDRLPVPYHIHTDWSHLGFDKYREGVAILSKYPLHKHDAKYVSDSHDVYSIHSRKVVMAQIKVPHIGLINVFSAHLSWWEDGFAGQFQRLCEWADAKKSASVTATLLCGDFNIAAGSTGYHLVVDAHQYDDQYLAANEQGVFDKIFRVNDPHWQNYLSDDYRIDYIFLDKTSELQVISARVLFTEQDYGSVSDHCGYFMAFEPK